MKKISLFMIVILIVSFTGTSLYAFATHEIEIRVQRIEMSQALKAEESATAAAAAAHTLENRAIAAEFAADAACSAPNGPAPRCAALNAAAIQDQGAAAAGALNAAAAFDAAAAANRATAAAFNSTAP